MSQTPTTPTHPSAGHELEHSQHRHLVTYPKFLWKCFCAATDGGPLFYAWMIFLTAVTLVGLSAWSHQITNGMAVTGMSDHVSWGMYIANFTFIVGLAAGGVMMVIPAYLYHDRDMHDVVIVGELLAIASIIMCLLFVTVDLGHPERFWHLMPFIGRFNFPISMLTWDVIVLNGYLLINLHICGYLLYTRFQGRKPEARFYIPVVFISVFWAISIHTVTAFLYCGLGGRPLWNSALLAPRFLASAFVSGPAFIILTLYILRRLTDLPVSEKAIKTLLQILRVTICINLLMVISEMFTEFYSGTAHTASARYLYFGLHGKDALVPWIWTAVALNIIAAIVLLSPGLSKRANWIKAACVMVFIAVWIEKGMGLIIPGFIPSTLHEVVEYTPTITEWKITAGIWAFGLLAYSASLKTTVAIIRGRVSNQSPNASPQDVKL